MVTMNRRDFITILGILATSPLAARAQQPGKLPTIGFLGQSTRSAASEWVAALVQRLRELGWIEGRTVTIDFRWAEGRDERFAEIAAEFVRLKVDVIVTSGTQAVIALKQATSVIPIVFATAGDPVGNNLVANLARPGGNVTGLATMTADLAGKRLELLREVIPGLRRLAIMGNVGNPFTVLELKEVQAAAGTLGLEVVTLEIRRAQDIGPTFEALKGRSDALYVCTDALASTQPDSNQHPGGRRATADDARVSGLRRSGRSHVLWTKLPGPVPAQRRLCRQDFARGEAGRHPGRAADQI
jgi:putative tryptophan/tyrosine transport system substrate-binding protein